MSSTRTAPRAAARRVVASAVAAFLLVAGASQAADGAVPAQTTTRCSELGGVVAHRVVEGDLVVDALCEMTKAAVTGDLVVEPGGRLVGSAMTVKQDLRLSGPADLWRASVYGGVVLDGPAAALTGGMVTIRHSVRGEGRRVALARARIEGEIDLTVLVDVMLTRSSVGGDLTARGGAVDLSVSRLAQALVSLGATSVRVCDTWIEGDVTFEGTEGLLWLGSGRDEVACPSGDWDDPRLSVLGTLRIHDAVGEVRLYGFGVTGDLLCTGRTGSSVPGGIDIVDVTVRGQRTGACAA